MKNEAVGGCTDSQCGWLPSLPGRLDLKQPDEGRLVLLLERDDVEDAESLACSMVR